MRKPYQLPGWTKNSSYYIVPRSGIEPTTSRLHNFIMAKVSHALNHSAMEAVSCFMKPAPRADFMKQLTPDYHDLHQSLTTSECTVSHNRQRVRASQVSAS